MWYVGWLAVSMAAACGYQELPRLSGVDAAGDGPDVDGPDVDGPPRPPQFTSCMGLAATCGFGANASCCEAAMTVQGGTFHRGYDVATDLYNDMGYPAMVSSFVLDRYEVTVGRFRAFVNAGLGTQTSFPAAGAGAHPKLAGSGWDSAWNTNLAATTVALVAAVKCSSAQQTWTDIPGANESKPMNCVSWYEAMAFCIWDGGYLPTEAEWNYAASGGNEQRAYPWSNPSISVDIDCTHANYFVNSPAGAYCVNGTTGGVNRVGSESPKGDGKWGHADLAGNVWEWTLDLYVSPYPQPCNDCANLTAGSNRVLRSGGFVFVAEGLRVGYRGNFAPITRRYDFGWRCARTP
jgi:formylglycine-generating enzyme